MYVTEHMCAQVLGLTKHSTVSLIRPPLPCKKTTKTLKAAACVCFLLLLWNQNLQIHANGWVHQCTICLLSVTILCKSTAKQKMGHHAESLKNVLPPFCSTQVDYQENNHTSASSSLFHFPLQKEKNISKMRQTFSWAVHVLSNYFNPRKKKIKKR